MYNSSSGSSGSRHTWSRPVIPASFAAELSHVMTPRLHCLQSRLSRRGGAEWTAGIELCEIGTWLQACVIIPFSSSSSTHPQSLQLVELSQFLFCLPLHLHFSLGKRQVIVRQTAFLSGHVCCREYWRHNVSVKTLRQQKIVCRAASVQL